MKLENEVIINQQKIKTKQKKSEREREKRIFLFRP